MTRIARVQDWVTVQAHTRPHAPAVVAGDERVSYGQLEVLSNQLARLLRDAGCEPRDRVALLMPKSAMALIAAVAIYKADGVFVPLDPARDPASLARIVDACRPRYLLAAGSVVDVLDQLLQDDCNHHRPPIGWLGGGAPAARQFAARFVFNDARAYPGTPPGSNNSESDPAHMLFPSPTGRKPRAVVTTHGSIISFVEWAVRYFGISTADRVSAHPPLHSGLATFDAFGAFAAGAELHLVPPELNLLPHALAEFIRNRELTQWLSVPAVLDRLAKFNVVALGDFPALKRLLWCGEVLPTPTLISLMKRLPHATFTRLYGQPEATVASGYYTVREYPRETASEIPLGFDSTHLPAQLLRRG